MHYSAHAWFISNVAIHVVIITRSELSSSHIDYNNAFAAFRWFPESIRVSARTFFLYSFQRSFIDDIIDSRERAHVPQSKGPTDRSQSCWNHDEAYLGILCVTAWLSFIKIEYNNAALSVNPDFWAVPFTDATELDIRSAQAWPQLLQFSLHIQTH